MNLDLDMRFKLIFFITILLFVFCPFISFSSRPENKVNLKEIFSSKFKIGAAINLDQIKKKNEKETKLIKTQFSSITAENIMKWEEIHPKPERYNFKNSDLLLELITSNSQDLIGHTLVWHNQIPQWVTKNKDGSLVNKSLLLDRIEAHIRKVAGRYSGKVKGWDVVNEAVMEDGSFRNSDLYKISGEEFIYKSFEIANKIDPNAELYYNDYSMYNPKKCDAAIALANKISSKGLRIDGIGMQAHWGLDYPTINEIEKSIIKINKAGFQVHITELDIDVLPNLYEIEGADLSDNFKSNDELNPYKTELPDSISNLLSERYVEIFKLFSKHSDKIDRVTFWGLSDGHSWKNDWPAKGRTNYPLLFDRDNKPKKAYHSIVNYFSEN